MKYEDSKNPSDLELSLLAKNYIKIQEKETDDLKEILLKMKNQKEYLIETNKNRQYDNILAKMEENIEDLERLINSNSKHLSQNYQKQFSKNPFKFPPKNIFPSISKNGEHYNNLSHTLEGDNISENPENIPTENNEYGNSNPPNNINNDSSQNNNGGDLNRENMSPNNSDRNIDDDIQNGNIRDNLNTNRDDSENNGISEDDSLQNNNGNLNEEKVTPNNRKRNSPMQSNPIFNAFKRFNVNMNRIFGRHSSSNSSTQNNRLSNNSTIKYNRATKNLDIQTNNLGNGYKSIDQWQKQKENYSSSIDTQNANKTLPQNRPHPLEPFPPQKPKPPYNRPFPNDCNPNDICRNNQIDIIRLFLLYMTLCPTCKYLPQISHIANEQFDILLSIMTEHGA